MPSFLVHMMVLIDAATTLTGPEEKAAEAFLLPETAPVPGGDHPVVKDVDKGKGVSQLAMLGANAPDIPGYRSFDMDADVFVLALLGGGITGISAIYSTLAIAGERGDDSALFKGLFMGIGWVLGVLFAFIPMLAHTEADKKRWAGILGSILAVPLLASGLTLVFLYSKEDTTKWYKRASLWSGIALLLGGIGALVLSLYLSLRGNSEPEDLNFSITYIVGSILGLCLAFSAGLFAFYQGADKETSIARGIAFLLCGLFLTILFPCLFTKVPNQQQNEWFDLLHKHKTGDFVIELIKIAKGLPNEDEKRKLMAFALGHISHLAADTIVHPYVNIFGGGAEKVTDLFSNFHRTVEVTQDSWIAREFFGRSDIFTGTSWTAYIDKAEGMKEKLDGYYRDAYQRIYHSQPPEGFITDSVGVMKDLVADEAFDNELYSVRMPLIWLSGVLPLALGGFLPSLLWSFPLSPYARLTGMRSLSEAEADEALYKLLVLDDLKDILKNKVKKEDSDAIFSALSTEDKDKILKEEVKTTDEAKRILGTLTPELRRKILDTIDREGIKTGSILGMSISGALSLYGWLSEIWAPSHWDTHHIVLEVLTWASKLTGFIFLFCGDTLLLWGTPIYQIASSLGGAFSLDKTLYSELTKMSVIPPEDPDDDRVRHSALGSGSAGAFYKDILLKKSAEFTKAMWKEAVKFYNGTIDEPALRQAIRNWNIDTGYRIEAKTETGSGGNPEVNITYKHSWKEYGI